MAIHVTLFATSLDPNSRSYLLLREAERQLMARNISTRLIDLRQLSLPLAGTAGYRDASAVQDLRDEVKRASHLLFGVAIYNYDVSAAAKNLIELLTSDVLNGKTVGFLCAAGGNRSYMSVLSFANSLMLDFRCWIVPRFVYAVRSDFDGDRIAEPDVVERIKLLTHDMFQRTAGNASEK